MRRTLPNRNNNYNGHGVTMSVPSSFMNDPKTIRRRMLSTGDERLIGISQAIFETGGRETRGGSWRPMPGCDPAAAMVEMFNSGTRVVTLQAEYWKDEEQSDGN